MTTPRVTVPVDELAQEIRRVDGNHDLGAGALAEALMPFLSSRLSAAPAPEGGAVRAKRCSPGEAINRAVEDEVLTAKVLESITAAGWVFAHKEDIATREEAPAEAGEVFSFADRAHDAAVALRAVLDAPDDATRRPHARYYLERLEEALRAQPPAREDAQPVGWLRAVDEEMVCAHLGVADAEDSFETAKKKLASLIQWNIAVATDPSVGGRAAPDALRIAVEALEPFNRAYQAYLAAYANFMLSGATEAEQRLAEGERKDTAEEAAFEVLSKITLEQLCAVNEALAALQAEQKGGA